MVKKQATLFQTPKYTQSLFPSRKVRQLGGDTEYRLLSTVSDEQNVRDLDTLVKESQRVLLRINAVFPFNFFPDEVIVDETKVSIIHKIFFYSNSIRSIAHEDIFNVIVEHSLFFATLEIVDRFFVEQPIIIRYLKKDDAILARRLIQGIIIAKKKGINLTELKKDELHRKIELLGEVH